MRTKRKSGDRRSFARNKPVDVFKHIDMLEDNTVCWPWKGTLRKGNKGELRPIISIAGVKHYAYRVVWELFYGRALETNEVVRHSCDNPSCCNPHHLQVGMQLDNIKDVVDRERVGEQHNIIKKIMWLLETGATAVYVTAYMRDKYDYEVDESVIRKIRSRRIYKQIPWPWGDERKAAILAKIAAEEKANEE